MSVHSDCKISVCLHSLWCEVSYYMDAVGWLFLHAVLCEVIFYSGMQRGSISPFLSNQLPWIPLKRPHSICLFYWMSCFYSIKKRTSSRSIAANNRKFWIISIAEHCGVILMSLAVFSIYILGQKLKWYCCDVIMPSDLLNKHTAFRVSPPKTDLTLLRRNSASVCHIALLAMQTVLYFAAALSV